MRRTSMTSVVACCVDPEIGAVVALSRFSVNKLPDSHLFRLEKRKIRYVHTLTACTIPNCGFAVRPPSTTP